MLLLFSFSYSCGSSSLSSLPPSLEYLLGLTLKCFLNTSRKYLTSLNPVISDISVMECCPVFNNVAARFRRISLI